MPDLKDDLLPTIAAIADFTGHSERRVRHLIDHHGFPAKKDGGKWTSRKSWIEHHYGAPDAPRNGARK